METLHVGTSSHLRLDRGGRGVRAGDTGSTSQFGDGAALIAATATRTFGVTPVIAVGGCVAVATTWHSQLVAAIPSAVGLTVLAATDLASKRVPHRIIRATALGVVGAAAFDTLRVGSAHRLLVAVAITALVTAGAALIWFSTSGIAFGDVKLVMLAAFVPAWLRGTAVVTMLLVAVLAAPLLIPLERWRAGSVGMKSTIPFGPVLLLGWLVGVLTA